MSRNQQEPVEGEPLAEQIMKRDVVTVSPDATVKELAQLFHERGVGGAPVVDDEGRVIGMVTEGDLVSQDADLHFPLYIQFLDSLIYLESVRKFEERLRKVVGAYVRDVMTTEVRSVPPTATVRQVATLMSRHRINRVPVVDERGRLVGIVGRHEVLESIGL